MEEQHVTVLKDQRKRKQHHAKGEFFMTCLSALGVVYGDIGTSPLYAVKSVFSGLPPHEEDVVGVISLIFCALTLIVCIKYLVFVMRADNHGEGGVFALLSQILHGATNRPTRKLEAEMTQSFPGEKPEKPHTDWIDSVKAKTIYILLAMVGSGLLLGDGVITPAISVLSAIEGLTLVSSSIEPAVVPITCVILFLLFMAQRFGTAKVGVFFGPIMVVWFFILSAMGIYQITTHPAIFRALNPYEAILFFVRHGAEAWRALGAVVLCITGCEAMFADMGHFGKNAVRASWIFFVYPALLLNYLGQGAMLIRRPQDISDPFFNMVGKGIFWPVFVVSIAATIIASQALISGAFSLTQQAVSMGYFPRLPIVHTSVYVEGQIYIPTINYLLMISGILVVVGFQTSSKLATAYGVAVCGDMLLTTFMFLSLARFRWHWPLPAVLWLAFQFGVVDIAFQTSNLRKVPSGGWFPLLFASLVFIIMLIWYLGEKTLRQQIRADQAPYEELVQQLKLGSIARCPGTGIFMSAVEDGIPSVLSQFLHHMPVLPETTVFLTLKRLHTPYVPLSRSRVIPLHEGCMRIVLETGFMENKVSVGELSEVTYAHGITLHPENGTFFLGNELVAPSPDAWFTRRWFVELYNLLLQYSHKATATTFAIPPKNVIYVGSHYTL